MRVLSGRRRSVSTAAPSNTGASKASESSPRRASFSLENSRDYSASGRNTLRNLFQKQHGAAPGTKDASATDVPHTSTEKHGNVRFTLLVAPLAKSILNSISRLNLPRLRMRSW
jgi:hypothetical protein